MSENKERRTRRTFSVELKQQIVDLYRGGKRKCDIIKEYDIASWASPDLVDTKNV